MESPPTKIAKLDIEEAISWDLILFNEKRAKLVSGNTSHLENDCKAIAYYMHRDQRVQDNWALVYAQKLALKHELPLHVVCLITSSHPEDAGATQRNLQFCLEGLEEVANELRNLNIAFHLLIDQAGESPGDKLADWMVKTGIGCLVIDFSPLRPHRRIVQQLIDSKTIQECPIYQVDAHNVVPVTVTSDKQECAARTIRNKITSKLGEFLTSFPPITQHPYGEESSTIRYFANESGTSEDLKEDWDGILKSMKLDTSVESVEKIKGGSKSGIECLESFVSKRIKDYGDKRNDPNADALSNLSPWFHLGHLSVQRAALYVRRHVSKFSSSFIEESVVRKELSDNYCYYNENYDNIQGASDWAQQTLNEHKKDKREYVYSRTQLDNCETHDNLWNAAQNQLKMKGKMHGFMRMYWAKKILEWTESPEIALSDALYFNDHYSYDGNDANGFVGCMWSICGLHDQGWKERPVFGKIRYMNSNGCNRKFNTKQYISKYGR